MTDDPVHDRVLGQQGHDLHPPAVGAGHGVQLIDLPDHGRPAFGGKPPGLLLNDPPRELWSPGLADLAPVGVRVEAVVSHSDGFGLKKPSGVKGGMPFWSQGEAREGKTVSEANVGRRKSVPPPRRPGPCL